MTVIDGATAYKVWWDHTQAPLVTKCFIRVGQPNSTPAQWDTAPQYDGIARLNVRDTYSRNRGRKVALKYALNALGRRGIGERKVFWEAYHTQLGHW